MPLRLDAFPVIRTAGRVSFHNGFDAPRGHSGLAHQAIDIGAPRGTPVVSTTEGIVVVEWTTKKTRSRRTGCGWTDAGGYVVLVADPRGYIHYYAHLNREPIVTGGDTVRAGQGIGEVGNTGSIAAGGPVHLHYQVWALGRGREAELASGTFTRPFGRAVNPYAQLRRLTRP